ncbi:MAG: type II toxin-antitoxin system VapC family toxin [Candidatus Aenigmarchaeota archaeon]|nr:type II toxin-antitoxin system VapC family toxin [Candidatus Aenigmarchaeota archaeon]
MKIYFDTGIIYPTFEKQVKNLPPPKVSKFLYNVKDRHEYFVSNLTKAEVFRKMHNDLGVDSEDCYTLWKSFRQSMNVVEIFIEEDEDKISFEDIAKMMSERPAPRGIIVNIIHLLAAKNHELTVLTSDEILKNRFKVYYTNIMTYDELRKIS